MRAKRLVTIAVVSTLLVGGVAALGAASPADQASDNAPDVDAPGNAPNVAGTAADDRAGTAADDRAGTAADDRAGTADGVGPSDGLPEQVPDHVGEIHDRIDSFLNGSIDDLGGSLDDLLGEDESDDVDDSESDDVDDSESDDVDDSESDDVDDGSDS
ncbi:hypothetical protein [Natronomonas sp. LN261]|uniref:hypothetical protein n=1 Tax=Natronomonas sp. LN261 TaxID=2750669 RepID=UPI0015EF45FF|nr:hypothetical protein [Natronomonas sp. LN261]